MSTVDLRSDTVTRPGKAMREVMWTAEVGDDVYGEDPTVNQLEALAAAHLGTEAALFASSGTQTNLLALLSQCDRGDEYICGQDAHTYRYEAGGAAVLGSIQPQPLPFEADGSLQLDAIEGVIKPDDFHFARTRLLCLENTQAGRVLPLAYLEEATSLARRHNLATHLDGARIFNAATKLDVPAITISRHFDTISCCLSKGLGAPVGSVLCGSAAIIRKARRWRKMLGGGMRQAGMLAAAGMYALNHNVARLAQDHAHAQRLAEGLASFESLHVDPTAVQTNMVFCYPDSDIAERLIAFLKTHDILISGRKAIRLVTHLDVSSDDVERVIDRVAEFFHKSTGG